jgi:sarcosine oxidase, subunit gamma
MRSNVLVPNSILRVQTWNNAIAPLPTMERALEATWPRNVGETACGRFEVLCIGPTDWLILGKAQAASTLHQLLEEALVDSSFRATDISQALIGVEVDGDHTRALLSKGCGLDLDASRFRPGHCARTRFAGIPVIIRCTRDFTFVCFVASSYKDYFSVWIDDAMQEFDRNDSRRVLTRVQFQ